MERRVWDLSELIMDVKMAAIVEDVTKFAYDSWYMSPEAYSPEKVFVRGRGEHLTDSTPDRVLLVLTLPPNDSMRINLVVFSNIFAFQLRTWPDAADAFGLEIFTDSLEPIHCRAGGCSLSSLRSESRPIF
eukprot:1190084-Prorocentrum_minimum.AAC.3